MIKNLKCRLTDVINSRRVRIGGMSLILALTLFATTLLGCPIHTVEIFAGHNFRTLNKMIFASNGTHSQGVETVTYPVYVTCGNETVTLDFNGGTVADALNLAGHSFDSDDFVEPALDTVITDTIYIDYTKVDYVTGSYTETIAFDTKTVYSDKKDKGYTELTQKGVNGEQEVTYTEKLVNGVAVEKNITSTNVLVNPKSEIKLVGTKVQAVKTSSNVNAISTLTPATAIELDSNGNPVSFKSKMTVRATAYTYTGNNCATGVAPQPGYIAVNPKVIPYGTKLYIKSPDGSIVYGYAVAADTGGFVRRYPTGIDLFMSTKSACTNFGVKSMEVYILE